MTASGELSKEQKHELVRLFEFVIDEAEGGNCWPAYYYVTNVQAVLEGKTLDIEEDDDD